MTQFLDPRILATADFSRLPPWTGPRIEILCSAPAAPEQLPFLRRFRSLLLSRPEEDPLPFDVTPDAFSPFHPSDRPVLAFSYAFLRGNAALAADDASSALAWLHRAAELSGDRHFSLSSARVSNALDRDPSLATRVIAWLRWEQAASLGPWARFAANLRAAAALLDPDNPPDPLVPARSSLQIARRTAPAFLSRQTGPDSVFEPEVRYRCLSLDAVSSSRPCAADSVSLDVLDDPLQRHLPAQVDLYRSFLRDHPRHPLFDEVSCLLTTLLLRDHLPSAAAREITRLLDLVRLAGPSDAAREPQLLRALADIYLHDLNDPAAALPFLQRILDHFPDSPVWAPAAFEAARIQYAAAVSPAPSASPPPKPEIAVGLLRQAASSLAALRNATPPSPDVDLTDVTLLEIECRLALAHVTQDPVLDNTARTDFVDFLLAHSDFPQVKDGSLLARFYARLSDDDLQRLLEARPDLLAPAFPRLDAWQQARARRLFPEVLQKLGISPQ